MSQPETKGKKADETFPSPFSFTGPVGASSNPQHILERWVNYPHSHHPLAQNVQKPWSHHHRVGSCAYTLLLILEYSLRDISPSLFPPMCYIVRIPLMKNILRYNKVNI